MKELIGLRRENTKTFDLGKGQRRLEAYMRAIHYKDNYADPGEAWKDIDLTWEGNRITKAPYELTLDGKKLTLKDKKTGEVSTIELLESKPAGLKWEIIPEYSRVSFRHTLPSDKIPFEARFRVTGKIPLTTRAFDDEDELPLETTFEDGILTEKLSSLPRPAKGNIRVDPTLNLQVGASSDDCDLSIYASYWSLTSTVFEAGYWSSWYPDYGSGARFLNVTIPPGATIDSAYLVLRARATDTEDFVNTRLRCESNANSSTFSTLANFNGRIWTAAYVNWDNVPHFYGDTDYTSPNIKTCVQEVIGLVGWASGNPITVLWDDFQRRSTQTGGTLRRANSYDGSTTYAPKLVIGYTTFPTQYSGLRAQIKGAMQELCLVAAGSGATGMGGIPKIRKGAATYDIYLVETSDSDTSAIRIKTTAGVKAIRKKT